jgi:hypothetical protein
LNICWCIAFCLNYYQVLFLENKPSVNVFFPGIIYKLHTKRQQEPGKTIEETCDSVRQERDKWPNSMIAT